MKRTALIFTCALLASPAFAASDLCTVNLQKLDDTMATNTTLGDPLKTQVTQLHSDAKKKQAAGDLEGCAAVSNQALMLLEKSEGGGSSGSGTGAS